MSNLFDYRTVDEALIGEITGNVERGENSVLLAPPCVGKHFALVTLANALRTIGTNPVAEISFRSGTLQSVADIVSQVAAALHREGVDVPESYQDIASLIDAAIRSTGKKIILITRNVDSVSHALARQYLQAVRPLVQQRQVVAVMSGAFDLRELVHGPNSEFEFQHQYVLQGLGVTEFIRQTECYAKELHLRLHRGTPAALHVLTGGNTYVMRLVLWTVLESRVRECDLPRDTEVGIEDLSSLIARTGVIAIHRPQLLRAAVRLIPLQKGCWSNLEKLIDDVPVELRDPNGAPGALTLSGITRRVGKRLEFSSQLIAEQVRIHYHPRRLADLRANASEWEAAVSRYQQLDSALWVRPSDSEDRPEAEAAVHSLGAVIAAQTGLGSAHLKALLDQGCRLLLGFPEVLFWQSVEGWTTASGVRPSEAGLKAAQSVQSQFTGNTSGIIDDQNPVKFSMAAVLPTVRLDQFAGLILGDFQNQTSISKERERLAKSLLHHFLAAHEHAVEAERGKWRLRVRTRHNEIIESILSALGSAVRDVRDVLSRAAAGLRGLGYRRVLFCLVDPKGERIEGEVDHSDDTSIDVARATSYALNSPEADIQPYVVSTRKPYVVPDAPADRLANKDVVRDARMKAFVVVPILDLRDQAIGTIHVERADMAVPAQEEIDDLMAFGRQLAVAIEQSERVNLLQSTLDGSDDPVIIVDALKRLRYANRPASDLLGLQPGWIDRGMAPPLLGSGTEGVVNCVDEAFKGGTKEHHHVCQLHGLGTQSDYRGEGLSRPIFDWRVRVAGAFVHIEDQNELFRVFSALELIASAKTYSEAMNATLEATRKLGHTWGRLYVTDPTNPEVLVGRRCFGPDSSLTERFERGEIRLPPRSAGGDSWKSIDDEQPVVFRQAMPGETCGPMATKYGLTVWSTDHKCEQPLEKQAGEHWLDFPLLMHTHLRGKITLQCDENPRPEHLEALKVLAVLAASLLDAIWAREQWIQDAADKSVATTAHNIATRFVDLANLLARYRRREAQFQGLAALNWELQKAYGEILTEIDHIKEMLSGSSAHLERLDLMALLRDCLSQKLDSVQFTIPAGEMFVDADPRLLSGALRELIQNSLDFARSPGILQINVRVTVLAGPPEWFQVIVEDNGLGIREEIRHKIFDDFFTERPGRPAGVGLGLTYVKRAVKAHGGAVSAEPCQSGACFVIGLPRWGGERKKDGQ